MWPRNALTERLGLDWPIIQAPMAAASTPELAAAVSNAGGLGSLGLGTVSAEAAAEQVSAFSAASNRALNANFFCHDDPGDLTGTGAAMAARLDKYYQAKGIGPVPAPNAPYPPFGEAHVEILRQHRPAVVSFHFGLPDKPLLDAVKAIGALVLCSATTVAEARALEAQGADAIIAQGTEAGGHRGTFLGADPSSQPGLFALLPQVVSAVSVPVIAAGGIVDGRTIAAAFMLGADAVQIGTAFLRCPEASIPDAYRLALAGASDDSSRITPVFTGKPARALRNRLSEDLSDAEADVVAYPGQLSLTLPLRRDQQAADFGDFYSMWSGQSVALTHPMPAADLMRKLVEETTARLRTFS
jgi:nitronate monooxygenase